MTEVVMVEKLFYRDEREGSDGENDLQAFHAELARSRQLLTPPRCRATTQPADLAEHRKVHE